MGIVNTEAIVLRSRNFQEADKILTLLSERHGKMEAVARGARRPRSRLLGATQPFSVISASLYKGKSIDTLSQAEVVEGFRGLREDLSQMAHATYMCELTDEFLGFDDVTPGVYPVLLTALHLLKKGMAPGTVRHMFQLRILRILGIGLNLDGCASCGKTALNACFSFSQGGVLCEACGRESDSGSLSRKTLESMRALLRLEPERIDRLKVDVPTEREISRLLDGYVLWHLDKSLKSLAFLKTLQGEQ